MITKKDIGRAIVEAGLTWSGGEMRDTHDVDDVVEAIVGTLEVHGIEVGE